MMSTSSSSTMASLSSCCASAAPAAAAAAGRGARASLFLPRVEAGMGLRSSPLLWQQRWNPLGNSRRVRRGTMVRAHLGQLPDPEQVDAAVGLLTQGGSVQHVLSRVEGVLYTLADATVAVDGAVQKDDGGWLGGLTNALEYILKFLKDGLASLNVPYSYGFAIILLTILVKAATYPLTKQQVESTLAMQNLQPKLKAIQQRYAGDQERIQLETARLYKQAGVNPLAGCLPTLATLPVWIGLYRALSNVANEGLLTEGFFWIPSLAGPTTLLTRESGSGVSWLFPFVDGHPPLGWPETIAYLVLPVLLVASQFASMQMMQPPTTDESQKNSQLILKFLPLMIGYFSLSVPSGLSLYWFTNNLLSTAQQVWLRNLGGAKPVVGKDGAGIISAGQAKRSSSSASALPAAATATPDVKEEREKRGEKFKRLKEEELKRKAEAARVAAEQASNTAAASRAAAEERERLAREKQATAEAPDSKTSSEEEEEEEGEEDDSSPDVSAAKDSLEGAYASNGTAAAGSYPTASSKKSKRSKRKRTV